MMGLLILAAILSIQSLPIGEALASVTEESGEDIAAITEGKASAEYFMNNYMPAAMKYSMNNAAYELEDGGINWENEASSASDPHDIVRPILDAWEDETISRINSRISNHHCTIEHDLITTLYPGESSYSLYNTNNIQDVEVESFTFNPVKISCNSETEYINETYSAKVSDSNRYIELVKPASEFFYKVEEEYSANKENIQNSYKNSTKTCGSFTSDDTRAIDITENEYESDTNSIGNIESNIDTANGITTTASTSDEYDEISNPAPVETDDQCDTGDCLEYEDPECGGKDASSCSSTQGCEWIDGLSTCAEDPDEDPACETYEKIYWHEDTAEIEPTYTSIDFEAKDSIQKVVAEGGYRNLKLEVVDYRFNY